MIPRYVVAEVDQDPWVLYHPDLHAANFIIDDDYNVLG
jgi:aminoglycoside phosphotransferase (APT) family kinase protein